MARGRWRRGRGRRPLGLLGTAPWRRAPLLLARQPGVMATVAGACAVFSAALAGVPLFLSSAGSEAVVVQADERCPRDTGATNGETYAVSGTGRPDLDLVTLGPETRLDDPFAPLRHRLEPSVFSLRRGGFLAYADGSADSEVVLVARDGALDHIEVIDGPPGPGLWISDRSATTNGLAPGDTATFTDEAGAQADVRVAGVYRDVSGTVLDDFWCAHADLLLRRGPGGDLPPPVMVADRATFLELMQGLDVHTLPGRWEAPLAARSLTLTEADGLITELSCGAESASALSWCSSLDRHSNGTFTEEFELNVSLPDSARVGPSMNRHRVDYDDQDDYVSRRFLSHLPFLTDRGQAIQAAVQGGIAPVAVLAAMAGAGLVGASASLWFDRRRREVMLLTVRGAPPVAVGLKAVLELLAPLVVGSAAGLGLAYALVVWLGPSSLLEPAALGRAGMATAAATLVAALVVGFVVGLRSRGLDTPRHRARWVAAAPWEVVVGVAALVSYRRLGEWGVPVNEGADVTGVDVLGLLFPVLFLIASVGVVIRLLVLALRPVRAISRRWPTALYLAVRRIARYRLAMSGLVVASALAAGVFGYAATLTRSLNATLDAKAQIFVGSDVAAQLGTDASDEEEPPSLSELPGATTLVDTYRASWVDAGDGRGRDGAVVLVIDPDTFDEAAFWDPTLSDSSLDDVLARLREPSGECSSDGSPIVPAVVVGADLPPVAEVGLPVGPTRFAIEQVADVAAFPGMRRGSPTVIVADSALASFELRSTTTEVWVRGDRDRTRAALAASGVDYQETRSFDEVVDKASFVTVSWTFGFMRTLGIAAGALVVCGIAVYLDARRRSRVLGYALARRMGLPRAAHRRAILAELAAGVVVGCWLGLGLALVAAGLAYQRIDPVPGYRPDPMLRPAALVVLVLATIAVAVAVVGALLAQRRTDADDPVEVLRGGV